VEGLVILALIIILPTLIAIRAIQDARRGRDDFDPTGRSQGPRLPAMPGPKSGYGGPGLDFIDDKTGDAGVRPRE
jgi:hypothetical protein